MLSRWEIEQRARLLLSEHPAPAVRVRLLRDVLKLPGSDRELRASRAELARCPAVAELEREQLPDGSWGRFHSMNSRERRRFPTSEIAIRRALALGLSPDSRVLAAACRFMREVLGDRRCWSDRVERGEGWPVQMRAITAGTLAQVDPGEPALLPVREYWLQVAARSHPAGCYDPASESRAHRDLNGRRLTYLHSRYVLSLLGAGPALPQDLERSLISSLWEGTAGIGYLGTDLKAPPPARLGAWLESLEILVAFPTGRSLAGGALGWLEERADPQGLWDLGSALGRGPYFPLSDDWRNRDARRTDHSTRLLACLAALQT